MSLLIRRFLGFVFSFWRLIFFEVFMLIVVVLLIVRFRGNLVFVGIIMEVFMNMIFWVNV